MKTQTKTEVRNSTARAEKLLRGIDNETKSIDQRMEKVKANIGEVAKILTGISNTALSGTDQTRVPAKKPAAAQKVTPKAAAAKKPAPVKKTAAAKKAAPAKKPTPAKKPEASAKKAQASAKKAEAKKAQATKPASKDRPKLVDVIVNILREAGTPQKAAEVYRVAVKEHGYWSRQSLYNALEKDLFVKSGAGADATYALVTSAKPVTPPSVEEKEDISDTEADRLIQKVSADKAVSAVQ